MFKDIRREQAYICVSAAKLKQNLLVFSINKNKTSDLMRHTLAVSQHHFSFAFLSNKTSTQLRD